MAQKSRKKGTKYYNCEIKKILSKEETGYLKWLFESANRQGPNNSIIAELKSRKDCNYCYSLGYTHYCDNPSGCYIIFSKINPPS